MSRRVGLMFGGRSVEHEISVVSARGVAAAIASSPQLECVPIAVTADGSWLDPEASEKILAGDTRCVVQPDTDAGCVSVLPGAGLWRKRAAGAGERLPIDVLFPLIHGWGGEDGRLQGALELAGVPYVGAGVGGSAVAMDKVFARRLFAERGLPVCDWLALERHELLGDIPGVVARIESELGLPVFVKPANGGSSVGISRVDGVGGLPTALQTAFDCDTKVIVEQGIDAREIECAVLGNERAEASVLGEIIPSREFYDYEAKYEDDTSELIIPADLEPEVSKTIRAHALSAFDCLSLSGLARVDFLIDRSNGQVHLNEVNTLPGFTSISMFPKLWEATGLPYPSLVERLVDLALQRRGAEQSHRRVRCRG